MLLSIRLTRGPVQDGLWLGEALLTDLQVVSWFAHMDPKDGQSYRSPLAENAEAQEGPFPWSVSLSGGHSMQSLRTSLSELSSGLFKGLFHG